MPLLFVGLLVVVLLAALASSSTVRETVADTAGTILDMIRLKPGVDVSGLQPEAWRIVSEAGALWRERGDELTVTSARDGTHSAQSLHLQGLAVDVRTRDLAKMEILDRAHELLGRLGGGYDVIIEADHLHVEYDNKAHVAVNFHPPSLASSYV